MTTPFPFTSLQVLTAAQLNDITVLPINDQTNDYTLVANDRGKRVIMNKATANTVTVNNSVFGVGDSVFIANKGAGVSTITAGAGVTINVSGSLALAQYGGGTLIALSASTFTFFPAGGVSTLDVEFLLVGGGGGGGRGQCGAGGGAGGFVTGTGIIGKDTYTVKVGAGGTGSTVFPNSGRNGTASSFISSANGGGGGAGSEGAKLGQNGASGGGGADSAAGGAGVSGEGNAGGNGAGNTTACGGGGGAGGTGSNGSGTTGGAGGAASTNDYTGSSISYSGGGGGGGSTAGGAAGTNAGAGTTTVGGNATANRGGGGGGGFGANNGGNGGSGQVVIRYLTADAAAFTITATGATSGTPTVSGAYSYFEYTSTGTLVVA